MKLQIYLPLTSAVLLAIALRAHSAAAQPSKQVGATASATATLTTTPTAVAVTKPKPAGVWRASTKAMTDLGQVHSEAILTDGFGAKDAIHLTGDCDKQAFIVRIFLQFTYEGAPAEVEIIVTQTNGWARAQKDGKWSDWTGIAIEAASSLRPFMQAACPGFSGFNKRLPPHLKNLGLETVSGSPVWHLRMHSKSQTKPVTTDVYVDESTSLWDRYAIKQMAKKKKNTFIEDALYSGFNVPVVVEVPPLNALKARSSKNASSQLLARLGWLARS